MAFAVQKFAVVNALAARWEQTFTLFANVLFAVSLFGVWGFLTLIGVVIDQGKPNTFYLATYPAPLARLIIRLGLNTIYHGPAYLGIIGLILTSLAVCTFRRVIPARLPTLRAVRVEKIPLNASLLFRGPENVLRKNVEHFLQRRGWEIRKRSLDGIEWTFADRHNWARRGVLVAHVGFVIIAAGTCLYWAQGFEGETTVLTGSDTTISQTQARIHLNAFRYRIDPILTKSGIVYQPIDYVSDVKITDHSGRQRSEIIRVNHPADIDGVLFYQASYGVALHLDVRQNNHGIAALSSTPLEEGDAFLLPGTTRSIRYMRFVGTIGNDGLPTNDPRPNNPGAIFTISDGDTTIGNALVPLNQTFELGGGFSMRPDGLRLYSGFTYRYDPGIPIVGIGACILLAGLCISLYLLPARLYARFDQEGEGWRLGLAATTVKGYDIFEEQFAALVTALRTYADIQELPSA